MTLTTTSLKERRYNLLSQMIIEAAMEVHKELGPGLMESVYEHCLLKVLEEKEIPAKSQVRFPIIFKGKKLEKEFIIDILVDDLVVLELKAIETILPVHEAQLLSYLKLSGKKLGLLINFNSALLKNGIRRRINGDLNT